MRCKKCGEENASAKRCCSNCGAFLEGYTFNNVTGKFGYRESDGSFTVLEKDNMELNKLDELKVREKATIPDLSQFIPNPLRDNNMKQKEENYCGGCCWFCYEQTNGWGQCIVQEMCDSMHCSDLCTTDKYLSKNDMRHYMAVLLQFNRYRRDDEGIYRCPNPTEIGEAIDFAVRYLKVFSEP